MSPKSVALGPRNELHVRHSKLVEHPPIGFSYRVESAQRTFLLAGRQDCPFEDGDWGEFSDFGSASNRIVHASRWPVLNHCAWIVDLDSIDYPLLGGRHALHPHFGEQFFGAWRPDWRKRVICRAANLIAAWSHPSCGALAFTSRYALSRAREWMQRFGIAGGIELLDRKGVVLYPAGPALPTTDYARKWSTTIPTVVFCGRDFEAKNGRVALKVFERLLKHCRCECVYLGAIPKVEAERYADTLSRISFLGETSPERARRVMAEAHILFHPSHFEAMATVFIEACGAGMVIVAAQGDQMDDMSEIFGHGGASVVHRRPYGNEQNEVLAFTDLIAALVNGTGRLKEMAAVNYELARTGPLSLAARDAVLRPLLDQCQQPGAEGLRLSDLPHCSGIHVASMSDEEIVAREVRFRRGHGLQASNILVRPAAASARQGQELSSERKGH